MKRTVLIVISIVLFLVCIPMIIGGIVLTSAGAGDDPTIKGRIGDVRSTGYAVVSDSMQVESNSQIADRYGLTIGVRSIGSDKPVFIGYGPADSVDSYLTGVPYTLVYSIGNSTRNDRDVEVPGTAAPQPPAEMTFWVQQSTGSGLQQIPVSAQNGDYRFVAMNADGSAGVAVAVYGSVKLPFLLPVGIGLLVLGGLLGILGIVLLVLGIRSKPQPPAGPQPPIAPYGYQQPVPQTAGPYPTGYDSAGPQLPVAYPPPGAAPTPVPPPQMAPEPPQAPQAPPAPQPPPPGPER